MPRSLRARQVSARASSRVDRIASRPAGTCVDERERAMTRAVIMLVVAACGVATLRSQERRFDVASLAERDRNTPLGLVGMQSSPGRLFNRCATLRSLVFYAF